jgi:hypothetical protein
MRERKHEEIARTLVETFDGAAEPIEAAMDDDLGDELLGFILTACPHAVGTRLPIIDILRWGRLVIVSLPFKGIRCTTG